MTLLQLLKYIQAMDWKEYTLQKEAVVNRLSDQGSSHGGAEEYDEKSQ
jgi:hypothetical protein